MPFGTVAPMLMEDSTERAPDSVGGHGNIQLPGTVGGHGNIQQQAEHINVWNIRITAGCLAFVLGTFPEVRTLRSLIDDSLKENAWRNALSHHATRSCQPRKHGGSPVFSLGDCGLDRCPRLPNGRYSVYVELPNSYEKGDAIKLSASGGGGSKKEAKRDVVLKLLTMLLTIGPQKIHLPAGAFTFGQDAINNIREVAYLANDALFEQLSLVDTSDGALADLMVALYSSVHARRRPERRFVTARTSQTASAPVNIMDESPGEGICRISGVVRMLVEFCRTARDGKFWPSKANLAQRHFLMTNVQPGPLRTIVEDNARLFELEEEATEIGRQWCIKLQKHDQEPTCAASNFVGIPVEQTASPQTRQRRPPPPTRPVPKRSAASDTDDAAREQASSSSIAPPPNPRGGAMSFYPHEWQRQ